MNKILFASQRVDSIKDYQERRDALDQRWAELFWQMGLLLQPVPNHAQTVTALLDKFHPDGILLTGGNDPVAYKGNAPERDEVDTLLIDYAVRNKKPILGVCRGMQSIIAHFGGTLKKIDGHIAVTHNVDGEINREVNSYHAYTVDTLPDVCRVLARSSDGTIESVQHITLPIMAMMWHPERVDPFSKDDLKLIRHFFDN
jgi:putative glutamine amidotransferase